MRICIITKKKIHPGNKSDKIKQTHHLKLDYFFGADLKTETKEM